MNYYNEFDKGAAAWLRELIKAGHIPQGDVDERSIVDVQGADLAGYNQCHFFAGIGGWPLALRLAGWPEDRPVWTGSCPCQPFSAAGKHKGTADERHLWPEFKRLIAECGPATCFGEQVASADGRKWLSGVRADLEGMAYRVGAADLCAAGKGAPHIRQRLYWVADASSARRFGTVGKSEANSRDETRVLVSGENSATRGMGHADDTGPQKHGRLNDIHLRKPDGQGFSRYDTIPFRDGKFRRVESGTFPLAHGVPARVGRLRGYGNAIVPQVAAEFIQACQEIDLSNTGARE